MSWPTGRFSNKTYLCEKCKLLFVHYVRTNGSGHVTLTHDSQDILPYDFHDLSLYDTLPKELSLYDTEHVTL